MKKILLSAAILLSLNAMAQTDTTQYSIPLEEAVWNFTDYTDTKPVLASDNFVCPSNWIVGNAGTSKASNAYLPFVYPSKLDETSSYGYDGRLCERIYGIASSDRVPVYAVLPLISDYAYDSLQLNFYGKAEASQTSTTWYGNLRIGYITSLDDTLKTHFAAGIHNFKDTTLGSDYALYQIPLAGLPLGARLVFYDDDATVINSCLLDNISITRLGQGGGSTPDPDPVVPDEPKPGDCPDAAQVYVYYPDLSGCFKWTIYFNALDLANNTVTALLDTIQEYDTHVVFDGADAGFINEITVTLDGGATYSGTATDGLTNYWMYNLNDVSASLGCSSQTVANGDVILWEYKTDWSSWDCTAVASITCNIKDMGTIKGPQVVPTDVRDENAVPKAMKIFRDGQIYILFNGKTYDACGRIVK